MSAFRILVATSMAALLAGSALAAPPSPEPQAANIRAHITFLASDLLEGREAGSPGYDIAANYVASQFAQLGLKPAGVGGSYFQPVPMVGWRAVDQGSFDIVDKAGKVTPLVSAEDFLIGRNPMAAETKVSADLVFVGFGIVAPEHHRNDYAGLNVKGKIVVVMSGAPKFLQTEERAYYTNNRTKRAAAEARGAIGMITMSSRAEEASRPFANGARFAKSWNMSWKDNQGHPFTVAPTVPRLASISAKGAQKIFEGAPVGLDVIMAAVTTDEGKLPRFALPYAARIETRTEFKSVDSRNVVGMVEGSDPKLKDEVIVLSAHLDHIGVSAPVKGDSINNGALDNASGIATTLEVARALIQGPTPPKRSVLVLANTGEEKGLVGAEYFARNPTVERRRIVADVNLDMPVLTYDFIDVTAFGADRSSIGPAIRRAAERMGIGLSPDPMPQEGLFTRSDHYRFVEVGVPAVFLMTGFGGEGAKAFQHFMATDYHKPSDDLNLPINFEAGAKFARLNYEITKELAEMPDTPAWNPGDFFGTKYGPKPTPTVMGKIKSALRPKP